MRGLTTPLLTILLPLGLSGISLPLIEALTTVPREPSAPPTRIVALTLGTAELIADLVPTNRIQAVSYLATKEGVSNVASLLAGVPSIRGVNTEELLKRHPDLILASRYTEPAAISQLRRCGLPVLRFTDHESFRQIERNVRQLGRTIEAQEQAKRIVDWMRDTLRAVREAVAGKDQSAERVLFFNGHFTAGQETLTDAQIDLAGGINLASLAGIEGYAPISDELVVALDPTVIVLTVSLRSKGDFADPRGAILAKSAWRNVTAIREGRVHLLPNEHLSTRSPYAVLAVVDLAKVLHPEVAESIDVAPHPSRPSSSTRGSR
ncbi:Hemin-binding periplasmic protein HmuT precursor [Planctomycetes bacterium Pan216]|uniref:Hemin-binding periplasmic protein HmuT n=1 Tax=Kolteria novifilia TaxID=2527975 RepID=A0A518B8N1_9BACT|nr:Hemin-binding periplasmic protein HmuT precursor [Planctomycetes bacterium Pan216]